MENDIVQYRFLVFGFSWQIVAEKFSFCKGWTPVLLEANNKTIELKTELRYTGSLKASSIFRDRPLYF